MTLDKVPFDLDDMLEHLSSIAAIKTDARRVELVFCVPRGVPARLVGDPLRLGQVLINLTNNAVKFTEEGEIVVAVEVAEREAGRVVLRFSVSDTGIGMDADQLARLFQSFTQADNSITRKYGGTGLGLSISKQLVELMGGTINVTSTPGVGSRFSFTVPLGIADAGSTAAPTGAELQRMRVMVVDDSPGARDALVEMLDGFGIHADAVASGEESLARLAQAVQEGAPYQVVLMDYMMPGWDGVETIRRIRADARFAAPPAILMVSACTREGVLQQEGELPLSGFLTKPVGPALLYDSLLQVLRPDLAAATASASGAHNAAGARSDADKLAGARILLVDDNANNREVALDFLAVARMRVDAAASGQEAIRMAESTDYDLVLMDIQMHEMDGYTATRALRALPGYAATPVVAMTAHAMAGDREKSLAAGMNDHVVKPIDPDLLLRTLVKWIDPARLAGRTPPQPAPAVPAVPAAAPAALPAVRGVDWHRALAGAGGQHQRLRRRIAGFLQEYVNAPQLMRDALANGDYAPLQALAHNLKSGAAYIGAAPLATLAGTLEQDLRSSRAERVSVLAPDLIVALDSVLSGLARIDAAQAPAVSGLDAGALLARLRGFLETDDARAEDALAELQGVLTDARHAAPLSAIRAAVDEIEYERALVHLDALERAVDMQAEAAT
jgi:CheY-like chemotaxis protein/HPt (histidine-containing phosphotransfer) domain-containing protein